jgi:hypothetical protein
MPKKVGEMLRGDAIRTLLLQAGVIRNQISAISGLTNTYIRDLEADRIQNVPRENLISLSVALNLSLDDVDQLLRIFDRAPLSDADIPAFLVVADRARLSTALHACHNIIYELVSTAILRVPSAIFQVNDKPPSALRGPGFRSHFDRFILANHPIYQGLVEAIGEQRRSRFRTFLERGRIDHYMHVGGIERYAREADDADDLRWRHSHIRALVDVLRHFPNFELHLTDAPANFVYSIVTPQQQTTWPQIVTFEGQAAPGVTRRVTGRLTGFATTNPAIISRFENDLDAVKSLTSPAYRDRDAVIQFLDHLIEGSR